MVLTPSTDISLHTVHRYTFIMQKQRVFCDIETECLYIMWMKCRIQRAVPWLRPCVAGLSRRRTGFDHSSDSVRFAVDKVAVSPVSIPVLLFFSPVGIIPPMLRSHFHINPYRTNVENRVSS